jgi:hypothetical protein
MHWKDGAERELSRKWANRDKYLAGLDAGQGNFEIRSL